MDLSPESSLVASAVRLVRGTFRKDFHDRFEAELKVLEFLLDYERLALRACDPEGERERLLDRVRSRVLAELRRPFSAETLATEFDMTRSHFSHFFRTHTGLTPARFIMDVRLREAARLLLETRAPLKQIADGCGFANVNHFSKVFRRHYKRSPGAYRPAVT